MLCGMADGNDGAPIPNAAFCRSIRWQVFNEEIYPRHLGAVTLIGAGVATGNTNYVVPRNQTLSLSASIEGRPRFNIVSVTRAVLESVSPERTYETRGRAYLRRFLSWVLAFVVEYALIWIALAASVIYSFILLIALLVFAPPFVAAAIVDFAWWSGNGFTNESRAKWLLAAALWILDVLPLVVLQILVR